MNAVIGNIVYAICYVTALNFMAGSVALLFIELGESHLMASALYLIVALLTFGFGWSSRRMLRSD